MEDTPGFVIGSVRTIPRERPSTMMERRVCVRGTSLAFLSAVITCHGAMSLLTATSSLGIWVTTVVNKIRISTTSANGGTYAGPYPCDGWVENLETINIFVCFLIFTSVFFC